MKFVKYNIDSQSFKYIGILNIKNNFIDLIIFNNVPKRLCIFHNLLKNYKLLPKQHTFSYIFTLISHNIDTPVISELNKLN